MASVADSRSGRASSEGEEARTSGVEGISVAIGASISGGGHCSITAQDQSRSVAEQIMKTHLSAQAHLPTQGLTDLAVRSRSRKRAKKGALRG